jgi:hypothetical protein
MGIQYIRTAETGDKYDENYSSCGSYVSVMLWATFA